jgi:sigma-B regulation protein RsbU (phosphoserine phosphatase)
MMLPFMQAVPNLDAESERRDAGAAEVLDHAGSDRSEQERLLADELTAVRREHAKLQQAIFEAAQVQRTLCAPRELGWGQFEIAGEVFPVRHLAGDFFKVMKLGSALGLVVGDVAGKGLTAGIWQAHVMGLVQRAARQHANPAAAMAEVNRELCRDDAPPPIMALFLARLDRKNNLTYCNAGLPAPLLVRQDKAVERLEEGGPMLGAIQNAEFKTGAVAFHPGDMLLAYSDGVTECQNAQDQEFEMQRLTAAATSLAGLNANKVLFSLLGAVLDFADSCSPGDDLTLLVVRRNAAVKRAGRLTRTEGLSGAYRRAASAVQRTSTSPGGQSPE